MEINDSLKDFTMRYEKTFIFVVPPDSTEESLFYVDRITPDREKIANLTLSSPEFGKIVLNMGTAHTLRFKYPPVGVYQSGADAYVFHRRPDRQYKRGLCNGNSKISPVHGAFSRQGRYDLTHQLVSDAFAGNQYTFKDAMSMLQSGKFRSVALRYNYALMLSPSADNKLFLLLHWEVPIAWVSKADGSIYQVLEDSYTKIIEKVKAR